MKRQGDKVKQPYTYTSREWDKEIELYFYRARYYDPSIGRFLNKDPIGFAGGDVNLYGYVGQNPLIWVDPYGLAARGNHKLDAGQVLKIKEQLKNLSLDNKTRNELKAKLKRHEKATGERGSRHSKDKKKKPKPKMGIGPTFIGPLTCNVMGSSSFNPFCLPEPLPDC